MATKWVTVPVRMKASESSRVPVSTEMQIAPDLTVAVVAREVFETLGVEATREAPVRLPDGRQAVCKIGRALFEIQSGSGTAELACGPAGGDCCLAPATLTACGHDPEKFRLG